jgi:RNA polymerase sigma-70 factor (ECF subfamily)
VEQVICTTGVSLAGESAAQPSRVAEMDDVDHLYRVYGARVSRFLAFTLNDADAAASLTQDCFLKAWRTRDRFRGECSVGTWLLRIACNLARDHVGTQKFRFWRQANAEALDIAAISDRVACQHSSAEQQMLAREQLQRVWGAVEALSERQRSVFVLRFVEEMDLQEIAVATGMPEGTVKTHLHRALVAVRKASGAEGGTR